MNNMFDNNQYKNPYSVYDPQYIQKLEQENKMLKEKQQQMSDPIYAQYINSPEVEADKMNCVMTFVFDNIRTQWETSELGKQFLEKHSPNSERFKQYKNNLLKANKQNQNEQNVVL